MSLHSSRPEQDAVEQAQGAAALELTEDVHKPTERQEPFQTPDARSQLSKKSHQPSQCSSNGSTSTAAARARAKSKAAQAQLDFAAKEASLMRQKADLEASLHVLSCQRNAAAAEAEAAAYEDEEIESGEKRHGPYVPEKPLSAAERAGNYVQQHAELFCKQPQPLKHTAVDPQRTSRHQNAGPAVHQCPILNNIKKEEPSERPPSRTCPEKFQQTTNPHRVFPHEPQQAQDLARYLTRELRSPQVR